MTKQNLTASVAPENDLLTDPILCVCVWWWGRRGGGEV